MDLEARIGWGLVIYAIAYLAMAGMNTYGWTGGVLPYVVELVVLAVVCAWAGSQLKFRSWTDILPYSIGWALIAAALDALYVVPFQGWVWYASWMVWVSYLLVALFPLLSVPLRNTALPAHRPWES